MNRIEQILIELNPDFSTLFPYVRDEITRLKKVIPKKDKLFDENCSILITYADQFQKEGETPLQTLKSFIENDLDNVISHVHILPFYPWTSDDGFSPIDYKKVEESYGSWKDIEELPCSKMFDCVFNHLSSQSPFFQQALKGDKKKEAMFHVVSDEEYQKEEFQENMKKVVRPRVLPLFSPYEFDGEKKWVWTTFSDDQIDTNLNNSDMVKYLLETFFLYIEKGSSYFRVDAVPFMWKEWGTNCSHHRKTHLFVKLLRAIVDEFESDLLIITESNVPHHENITYWGNGSDEAHVIYNFTLSPLLLHALVNKTSKHFSRWANGVFNTAAKATYLNFTATHDGIGLRGVEGVVPEEDVLKMCELAKSKGGQVGMKRGRDGSEKPYELNITWASFLDEEELDRETYIKKVVHSQSLVMFLPGIGAHYAHNFLGSKNWQEGFKESGIARRLNRRKLSYPLTYDDISTPIKERMVNLIKFKSSRKVFSPSSGFSVCDVGDHFIAFKRFSDDEEVLVVFNLSAGRETFEYQGQRNEIAGHDLVFIDL